MNVEVRTASGWARLSPTSRPGVLETEEITIRGLPPGAAAQLGPVGVPVDPDGGARLRMSAHEELSCHLGYLELRVREQLVGEIEILPGKITEASFRAMRADLEATWLGVVLDESSATAIDAAPDVVDIWRRLRPVIERVTEDPRSELVRVAGYGRVEKAKRPEDISPHTLVAGVQGRTMPKVVLEQRPVADDHALVADTLRRVEALAHRLPDGGGIASECSRLLRDPLFAGRQSRHLLSHGARFDARYRQVAALHRELNRPLATVTTGPADLRAGAAAMDRLYEYWVFLQVIQLLTERVGAPPKGEVAKLVQRRRGGGLRLEIPAGTEIRFPDGTKVAFTPTISTNPLLSWQGLEHLPHPDDRYAQLRITPDVVIDIPGRSPRLVVIDAKYRGRDRIDAAAATTHARYSRIRDGGERAVREVVVAHPHQGLHIDFAGYSAVAFTPGLPVRLPDHLLPPPAPVALPVPVGVPVEDEVADEWFSETPDDRATVIADQSWMRAHLQDRRVDLDDLLVLALGDHDLDRQVMVVPAIGALEPFYVAAERLGWEIVTCTTDRAQARALISTLARAATGPVILISGDPRLISDIEPTAVVDDLSELPDLHSW